MRYALAFLFLAALLSGCTDAPADNDPTPTPTATTDDGAGGTNTAVEPTDAPWTTRWFLHPAGLAPTDPGEGSIPLNCGMGSFAGACSLGDTESFSEPFPTAVHLPPQDITLELYLTTDAVALGNPVFDIAAWVGTSRGSIDFTFTSTVVMTPGAVTPVSLSFPLADHPGVVIPAGEALMVRILGAYEPEGAGLHRILTGGATPSGLELTLHNLTADPLPALAETDAFAGTLHGGAFIECPRGETIHRFTVDPNATAVDIHLTGTPLSPTTADIDLDLFDGDDLLWHAGSPYTSEEILLAGPALEPFLGRELGVGASICLGPEVSYAISVQQG